MAKRYGAKEEWTTEVGHSNSDSIKPAKAKECMRRTACNSIGVLSHRLTILEELDFCRSNSLVPISIKSFNKINVLTSSNHYEG